MPSPYVFLKMNATVVRVEAEATEHQSSRRCRRARNVSLCADSSYRRTGVYLRSCIGYSLPFARWAASMSTIDELRSSASLNLGLGATGAAAAGALGFGTAGFAGAVTGLPATGFA